MDFAASSYRMLEGAAPSPNDLGTLYFVNHFMIQKSSKLFEKTCFTVTNSTNTVGIFVFPDLDFSLNSFGTQGEGGFCFSRICSAIFELLDYRQTNTYPVTL